jgi:formate dehydrogenase subunit gamma
LSGPGESAEGHDEHAGRAGRAGRGELVRFDRIERLVHWSLALIVIILLVTGSILYIPILALDIGHRAIVENIHVYVGLALPVPILFGLAGPWRRGLAADLRRLNRWAPGELRWFRILGRGKPVPLLGKFNPGQKLNAAVIGGALLVMLGTGVIMRFAPSSWIEQATGATLVHDTLYLVVGVLVAGHVLVALSHPEAMRSMLKGRVPRVWARRNAPRWLDECEGDEAGGDAGAGGAGSAGENAGHGTGGGAGEAAGEAAEPVRR